MATRRWMTPRVLGLGTLVLAVVTLFSVLVPILMQQGEPAVYAFLFGALLCAAPLVALRYTRWSIAMFCVSAVVLPVPLIAQGDLTSPWPWSVPALLVLVVFVAALAVLRGWRSALLAWLLSIGGTLLVVVAASGAVPVQAAITNLVVVTSVSGTALIVAVLAASRRRIGAELSREREVSAAEHERRVLIEERSRIARELHDVVAHGMSLIQVQASTARYRVPELSAEASTEFDDIARTARDALAEMRRLLGVLRTEGQEAELVPQQGLADIPALVESVRRAGTDVSFEPPVAPPSVPAAVGIAAFRIVQEALSNAMRHAPGAAVDVVVAVDATAVRIRVHNTRAAATEPKTTSGRGHGLLGMRERATLVGGTLRAGADPVGGWTVTADLPVTDPEEQ
ncbi:sensor histidine kinase [Microbacterium mangrovi]|uniref:sensor histidine kinase n=1 Tax=Microbacterium mangrovi TaxID=1348253 RepID=UPI00068F8D2F|nr:histidine kinase [Microbacterium mangrovi]